MNCRHLFWRRMYPRSKEFNCDISGKFLVKTDSKACRSNINPQLQGDSISL